MLSKDIDMRPDAAQIMHDPYFVKDKTDNESIK